MIDLVSNYDLDLLRKFRESTDFLKDIDGDIEVKRDIQKRNINEEIYTLRLMTYYKDTACCM